MRRGRWGRLLPRYSHRLASPQGLLGTTSVLHRHSQSAGWGLFPVAPARHALLSCFLFTSPCYSAPSPSSTPPGAAPHCRLSIT
ncbi:hypothetical protein E2C01_014350 [Portunus trituberculatus]|uniref:Uncharacterized protein n=1 Tax=Portunus trituberculatus TaxID=210409 RepID=A0A5B7DJR6_PORTR|nr:hypothetical protein [Portunus trituberculatus]